MTKKMTELEHIQLLYKEALYQRNRHKRW